MEEFLYEVRPLACVLIGAGAATMPVDFGRFCGVVLLGIGVYIWRLRSRYRRST